MEFIILICAILLVVGIFKGGTKCKSIARKMYDNKIADKKPSEISSVNTIKVGKVTLEVDEKLRKTNITNVLRKNKVYKELVEDFAPSNVYSKSNLVFAVDKIGQKTCIIADWDSVSFVLFDEFIPIEEYMSTYIIALDTTRMKICIADYSFSKPNIFTYKDILSVEITEDEETITKTQRGSQIAGAVVGGALLGGAGAIIGGLSGSKKSRKVTTEVAVKIIVNDITQPSYSISFNSTELAERWYGIFKILINTADKEESQSNLSNDKPISIADELQKLVTLRDNGTLSESDYNILKNKIIAS